MSRSAPRKHGARWWFHRVPIPLREAPFETVTALLLLLAGIPLALGRAPAPGSMSRLLPPAVNIAWGVCMSVGSVLILAGLVMAARSSKLWMTLRGRGVERLGLLLLGWVLAFYALAIALVGGWRGVTSVALTLAYAAACLVRAVVLASTHRVLWQLDEQAGEGGAGGAGR